MRRRAVEVKVVFLDVLAVIAFVAGKPEQALFQDRIAAVPQRERKTDLLVAVADACDAVFIPAVRFRPRMIVWQMFPGRAPGTVVFADRATCALADVRSPALQVRDTSL